MRGTIEKGTKLTIWVVKMQPQAAEPNKFALNMCLARHFQCIWLDFRTLWCGWMVSVNTVPVHIVWNHYKYTHLLPKCTLNSPRTILEWALTENALEMSCWVQIYWARPLAVAFLRPIWSILYLFQLSRTFFNLASDLFLIFPFDYMGIYLSYHL